MKNMNRRRFSVRNFSFLEILEDRRMLAVTTSTWDADIAFDQFSGGEAKVVAVGYTESGQEDPELLGFDFCRRFFCDGDPTSSPIRIGGIARSAFGDFGGEVLLNLDGKIGLEYGFYANAGSANVLYDGTVDYQVTESPTGPATVRTNVDYAGGALFTQSPTIRAYVDLVFQVNASVSAEGCFFGCASTSGQLFSIDERVPLMSINRNGDGRIKMVGEGIVDAITGAYDQLQQARELANNGLELYRAARDSRQAQTQQEADAAEQRRMDAEAAGADGRNRQMMVDDQTRAKSQANGGRFGGGSIITVEVGQATNGLLGVQFDVGAGFSAGGISANQRLGDFSVTLPDIALADTRPNPIDHSLVASTLPNDPKSEIAGLSLDVGGILGGAFGMGTKTLSAGPVELTVTTVSYDIDTNLNVNQEVSAQPKSEIMRFDFFDNQSGLPAVVDVLVDGVTHADVTTVDFPAGAVVDIVTEGVQEVRVEPSFEPTFSFDNDIGLDLDITGTLRALAMNLSAFGESIIDVPPVFERSDALANVDLGSIFDTTFDLTGNRESLNSFVVGGPRADVAISVMPPPNISEGTNAEFQVTVSNQGNVSATGTQFNVDIPDGFEFVEGSNDQCTFDGALMCSVGEVAPNSSVNVDFEILLPAESAATRLTQLFEFEASAAERDVNPFNNRRVVPVDVHQPRTIYVDVPGDFDEAFGLSCGAPGFPVGGVCTLRQAVREANLTDVRDTIVIVHPSGAQLDFGEIVITSPMDIIGRSISSSKSSFGLPSRLLRIDIDDSIDDELGVRIGGVTFSNGSGNEGSSHLSDSTEFSSAEINPDTSRIMSSLMDGFREGDLVTYRNTGGMSMVGLQDGVTYELINYELIDVSPFGFRPSFQIALPGSGTPIPIEPAPDGSQRHILNPHELVADGVAQPATFAIQAFGTNRGGISRLSDTIEIENNGLSVGQSVTYRNAGAGQDVPGLVDGSEYYVIEISGGGNINGNPLCDNCFITLSETPNGPPVDLDRFRNDPKPLDGLGGAIYQADPSDRLLLVNSHFQSNSSDLAGGAIFATGNLELRNVTFSDNTSLVGGAIAFNEGSIAEIRESLFESNQADDFGGAIHLNNANLQIVSTRFLRNSASEGGAIFTSAILGSASLDISKSLFRENSADVGAVMHLLSGADGFLSATMAGSVLDDNEAPADIETSEFDSGMVEFVSAGFNLTDKSTSSFDNPSDQSATEVISIGGGANLASGVPAAVVGPVEFHLPGVNATEFSVDDPRFLVESGVLRLVDGEQLDFASTPHVDLVVTVTDQDGQAWTKTIAVNVLLAPTAPTDFITNVLSPNSLELSWSGGDFATEFLVTYVSSAMTESVVRLDAAETQVTLTDLPHSTEVVFVVEAINASGSVAASTSQAMPVAFPVPPTDLAISRLLPDAVELSWVDGDFESFVLVTIASADGDVSATLPADTTTHTVEGLDPDTEYSVTVTATNATGQLSAEPQLFRTPFPIPDAPLDFQLSNITPTSVELNWSGVPNASEYRIFEMLDDDSTVELARIPVGETSYVAENLPSGSDVRFLVMALNSTGGANTLALGTKLSETTGPIVVSLPPGKDALLSSEIPAGVAEIDLRRADVDRFVPNVEDVIRLTRNNSLTILADPEDVIEFDATWSLEAPEFPSSRFAHVFVSQSAKLFVDNGQSWTNPINPLDASLDGSIGPLDALLAINRLDQLSGVLGTPTPETHAYIDSNRDGVLSPLDPLLIINALGSQAALSADVAPTMTTRVDATFAQPVELGMWSIVVESDEDEEKQQRRDA